MATELAKAYVQIIPSASGMQGRLSEELGAEGAKAGNMFGISFKKMIAALGIGMAVKKVISDAFENGAALQQSLGGIETLFKDSSDKMKAYASEAYKTAGVSANTYMEQVTSFSASLLQSLGGDTNKAADVANQAMIDMSDNANKFGTDMQDIQNAYQGFAKQNYTMLDNLKLGYGGTKTEMERLLADAQKLTGVKYDINNLSDVYEAIHVIQENLGVTGTTAKEAATTWSGSFAAMKAAYEDLTGNLMLGNDITPQINNLASTITTFVVGNFIPAITNIVSALPSTFLTMVQTLIPMLLQQGGQLIMQLGQGITDNLPTLLMTATDMVSQFVTVIGEQAPTVLTTGMQMLMSFVNGILEQLPQMVDSALNAVMSFTNSIFDNLPTIIDAGVTLLKNLVSGILNSLPDIVNAAATAVLNFVTEAVRHLPELIAGGFQLLSGLIEGIGDAIPQLLGTIGDLVGDMIEAFAEVDWFDIGANILKGIWNGIKSLASSLWDGVKNIAGGIKDGFCNLFGINSPARWGIWAGKMIDLGIAGGLEKGLGTVMKSVGMLEDTVMDPFNSGLNYNLGAPDVVVGQSESEQLLQRVDVLVSLLEMIVGTEQVTKVEWHDRELARMVRTYA